MYPFAQHYARESSVFEASQLFSDSVDCTVYFQPMWSYFIYSEMKLPTWSANLFSKEERSTASTCELEYIWKC